MLCFRILLSCCTFCSLRLSSIVLPEVVFAHVEGQDRIGNYSYEHMLFLVYIVCLDLTTALHVHELDTVLRISREFHMRDDRVSFCEPQNFSNCLLCN